MTLPTIRYRRGHPTVTIAGTEIYLANSRTTVTPLGVGVNMLTTTLACGDIILDGDAHHPSLDHTTPIYDHLTQELGLDPWTN